MRMFAGVISSVYPSFPRVALDGADSSLTQFPPAGAPSLTSRLNPVGRSNISASNRAEADASGVLEMMVDGVRVKMPSLTSSFTGRGIMAGICAARACIVRLKSTVTARIIW